MKNTTETNDKAASTFKEAEKLLAFRLKQLGIQTFGLPQHVLAHLHILTYAAVSSALNDETDKIKALKSKTEERLQRQVAITLKTVGLAFRLSGQKQSPDESQGGDV